MTFKEFEQASKKLVETYGDKVFVPARLEVIYDAVRHVDAKVWQIAVKEIIAEFIYAPPVSKIREVLRAVQSRNPVNQHWTVDGIVRASTPIPERRHDDDLTPEERAQKAAELKALIAKTGNLGRGA